MQVSYGDKSLERLCTDEKEMRKRRADIARKLPLRIKALEAAPTLADLVSQDPLGYWHELTADRAGAWSGRLTPNQRIIIEPTGETPGLESVTVTVIELVDYH